MIAWKIKAIMTKKTEPRQRAGKLQFVLHKREAPRNLP